MLLALPALIHEIRTMYLHVKSEKLSNEDLLSLFCVRYHFENPQNYYKKKS